MTRLLRSRRLWLVGAAPTLLLLAGCDAAGHARFTPTQDEARSALEAVLAAWRDGRPFGPIEATLPVHVADSLWQGGQAIEAFQIGDGQANEDGTKRFPVKLTMKKTKAVQDIRYVVYGRDPVWVFNEADYQRMIDMGNGPETPRGRASRGRPARR